MTDVAPPSTEARSKPTILVTYDGSEVSEAAFGPAASLAGKMNARVVLFRVLRAPPEIWSHPDAAYRAGELQSLAETAQREIEAIAGGLQARFAIEASGCARLLEHEWNVPAEIIAAAGEVDAELICMATNGEGGIRQLLLGSTCQEVIKASDRPVVLVRGAIKD
jgi:nucleotide-binding universal stress UspA family protein